MTHHKNQQSGFALLLAIIVVGVVVSVGLTILDLSLKQVRLSTNSRDSETAFHAANAGLECARYWRVEEELAMDDGDTISPNCFGVNIGNVDGVGVTTNNGNGDAYLYEFEATWGSGSTVRCSQMSVLTIKSPSGATAEVPNMSTIMPGYPYTGDKECEPGGRCTVIAVRGFSRSCANIGMSGTVQREVLLEL
jgi:Tfp pilus assembly protein PilX